MGLDGVPRQIFGRVPGSPGLTEEYNASIHLAIYTANYGDMSIAPYRIYFTICQTTLPLRRPFCYGAAK